MIDQAPVVSVVIPVLDRVPMLERALASVRAQTLESWDAIVVDDASTDPIAASVERLGDPRVRYVRRDRNGGVAAAQNTGLGLANGRYVAFLHSDDEFLPDRLTRLSAVLDASPAHVGAVESGHEERDEHGKRSVHAPYLDGATARDALAYRAGVHISKLLLRREVADAIRFDDALRGAEDRDFAIRLLRETTLAIDPAPLVRIERTIPGLRAQPKGPIYEYLLAKYHDDIVNDRELHRSWWFRIARAHAKTGDLPAARGALRRAVRADPTRVRLWPLGAAALLGDRAFAPSLSIYQRIAFFAD